MTTTLNKADTTLGKMQYHLRVKPGDPDRVRRIAIHLEDAENEIHWSSNCE